MREKYLDSLWKLSTLMFIPASEPSNRNQQFLQAFCAHSRLPFLLCENICHRLLFSPQRFLFCLPHNVNFVLKNNFGQHLISFMWLRECFATALRSTFLRRSSFLQSNLDSILCVIRKSEGENVLWKSTFRKTSIYKMPLSMLLAKLFI